MSVARDVLIEQHKHLVALTLPRVVPRVPPRIDPGDLEAAGYLGLCEAATRFDPARGVAFRSLAITWIRGAMLEHLRGDDWVPRSVRAKEKAGEPVEIIEQVSLDDMLTGASVQYEGDPLFRIDQIADLTAGPEETVVEAEQARLLWQAVGWLPERERDVLRLYYGEGLRLKQIAVWLGRSESRAHQLHAQALERLRERETMIQMAEDMDMNGRREWTPEEEALLRQYPQKTHKEIALDLGRTVRSVKSRYYHLRNQQESADTVNPVVVAEEAVAVPPSETTGLQATGDREEPKSLLSPVACDLSSVLDPELAAMQAALSALLPLDERTRLRALGWLAERFEAA